MLVNKNTPKWMRLHENNGEIEVSLGPDYVTLGFVGRLQKKFNLSSVRIRLGHFWATTYDEYALDGDTPSITRKCRSCGSERQVPLWDVIKELGKPKRYYNGEKYRWSYSDRRGLLKDVTFHATVPRESVEAFYRFMEHLEDDEELPGKVREFLKEAAP